MGRLLLLALAACLMLLKPCSGSEEDRVSSATADWPYTSALSVEEVDRIVMLRNRLRNESETEHARQLAHGWTRGADAVLATAVVRELRWSYSDYVNIPTEEFHDGSLVYDSVLADLNEDVSRFYSLIAELNRNPQAGEIVDWMWEKAQPWLEYLGYESGEE